MSVEAGDVLAARRELAPGKSVLEHAETIYLAVLSVGILGSLLLGAWHGLGPFLLDLIRPYRSIVGAPAVSSWWSLATLRFCTCRARVVL